MAEITAVLAKLLERTNEGKIQWRPTSSDQTFIAVVGSNSVMVQSEGNDVVLRILDKVGRELEALHTSDTLVVSSTAREIRDLHVKARNLALNVGSQLDELLKELG